MTTKWLRPEHKDSELVQMGEFAKRRGISLMSLRGHVSRYHDWLPEVVRVDNGRAKYYLPSELDDFLDRILTNDRPRSRAEKAAADVSRIREWVEDQEAREAKRREDYEKAVKDLKAARATLREAEEKLSVLRQ